MSNVLDQIREKYPAYEDVPDDKLALAIGNKYPVYLDKDPEFKKEFTTAAVSASVKTATKVAGTVTDLITNPAVGEASAMGQEQAAEWRRKGGKNPGEVYINPEVVPTAQGGKRNELAPLSVTAASIAADVGDIDLEASPLKSLGITPENIPSGEQLAAPEIPGSYFGMPGTVKFEGPLPRALTYPLSSAAKTITGIANWMTSLSGIAQMGAAAVPGLDVVMGCKFIKDMVEGGWLSLEEAGKAYARKDWQGLSDSLANAAAAAFGSGALGVHTVGKVKGLIDRGMELKNGKPVQGPPATGEVLATPKGAIPPDTGVTITGYHGSQIKGLTELLPNTAQQWGKGIYLATDPTAPKEEFGLGGQVYEAEVTLKKPFSSLDKSKLDLENTKAWKDKWSNVYDDPADAWSEESEFRREVLQEHGYDGVIDEHAEYGKEVVAFDKSSVKLKPSTTALATADKPVAIEGIKSNPIGAVSGIPVYEGKQSRSELTARYGLPSSFPTTDIKFGKQDLVFSDEQGLVALWREAKPPPALIEQVAPLTAEALKDQFGGVSLSGPAAEAPTTPAVQVPEETTTSPATATAPATVSVPPEEPANAQVQAKEEVAVPAEPALQPEPETTTIFDPNVLPTSEVDVSQIKLSEDVPNFKGGANAQTGIVPEERLQGSFTRLGTAPIVVWKRLNGDLEIITGRHRLDLAKRSGEKTIPAQIVDESKGFTKDMALVFDAEANIRDGQGSVGDYAHYFKNRPELSESDAKARGLLSRAKGRSGWDLGRNASDDLYAIWKAEKVSDAQAVAIAKAAPGNAKAQQIGIRFAIQGKSSDFLSNIVKTALHESGGKAESLDLFGSDDSAMQRMAEMASKAAKFQKELRDQIQAVQGAVKRPDVARKLGVDVKDPEGVQKKLDELKSELARWENWPTQPDLMAKVKGEPFELSKPESVEEQKSRLKKEAELKASIAAKETVAQLAAEPIKGGSGDLGQGDLLGGGDLFSPPMPKPKPEKPAPEIKGSDIGQGPGARTATTREAPESVEGTGMKNAIAELEAAGVGHDLTPSEQHAMAPLWEQAKGILKVDKDAGKRLADDLIENPNRGMTDEDSALLLNYKVSLINRLNDAAERTHVGDAESRAAADRDYISASDDLKALLDAVKKRGTHWGREGKWRQAMAYEDYSFATQEGLLRSAKGGLPLTPDEIAKLKADVEAHKANAAAQEAHRIAAELKAAELNAKLELERLEKESIKKQISGYDKRILDHAEKVVSKMESAAKNSSAKLKEMLMRMGTSPDPTLVYHAAVVASARIARAGLDIAKLTDEMVRDYGKKIEPLMGDIWNKANEMIDNLKAPEPVKSAVRDRADRLATFKANEEKRQAKMLDRIAKGDVEPKKRPAPPPLDPEGARLMAQGREIERRLEGARRKAQLARRGPAKKAVDALVALVNSPRSIAVFGHGTVGMFTHAGGLAYRPSVGGIFWKNFLRQFKMTVSPAYHEQLIHRLKTDPEFHQWLKAGASIDPDTVYTDYEKYGKLFDRLFQARGFDALKLTRMELNKRDFSKLGDDIKADPEKAQAARAAIAEINNRATGTSGLYGKAGPLNISGAAHAVFFAPKLYVSRWSRVTLDPIKTLNTAMNWEKATPEERTQAQIRLKHAAEFAAVYLGGLALNQGLLKASGSNQNINFTDPTQKDWLKFKAHGKDIIADGGLLDPIRLIGQVVYGDLMKPRTNRERFLKGSRFEAAAKDIGNYARSKLNPSLGLIVDSATGQDYSGRALPGSQEPSKYKAQNKYTWGEWILAHGPIPGAQGSNIVFDELQKHGLSKPDAAALMEGAAAVSVGMTGVHETEDYSLNKRRQPAP